MLYSQEAWILRVVNLLYDFASGLGIEIDVFGLHSNKVEACIHNITSTDDVEGISRSRDWNVLDDQQR